MTEKKEIHDWTQINEEVARLIAQLPLVGAGHMALGLAGAEATPELTALITKLQVDQAQKPLLDFYMARNLNLLDELENSLLDRVPDDEAHDTLKAVVTGLYINDQSNEFAALVTSFMLLVKLMEVRYSQQLRAMQDSLQQPDGGEGGAGAGGGNSEPDADDDRVRM